MSDITPLPAPVPMMGAAKARDHGRMLKAWAEYLHGIGLQAEATRAERDSQWWLAYAQTLSATEQGCD